MLKPRRRVSVAAQNNKHLIRFSEVSKTLLDTKNVLESTNTTPTDQNDFEEVIEPLRYILNAC